MEETNGSTERAPNIFWNRGLMVLGHDNRAQATRDLGQLKTTVACGEDRGLSVLSPFLTLAAQRVFCGRQPNQSGLGQVRSEGLAKAKASELRALQRFFVSELAQRKGAEASLPVKPSSACNCP